MGDDIESKGTEHERKTVKLVMKTFMFNDKMKPCAENCWRRRSSAASYTWKYLIQLRSDKKFAFKYCNGANKTHPRNNEEIEYVYFQGVENRGR